MSGKNIFLLKNDCIIICVYCTTTTSTRSVAVFIQILQLFDLLRLEYEMVKKLSVLISDCCIILNKTNLETASSFRDFVSFPIVTLSLGFIASETQILENMFC